LEIEMALNFEIIADKTGDGFSLNLKGDFDGTSAYELVYAIKKLADKPVRIYVNTSELKRVHPFGLDVFDRAIRFSGRNSAKLIFRGNQSIFRSATNSE
jgi:anti-anti-sigma regulatory factor